MAGCPMFSGRERDLSWVERDMFFVRDTIGGSIGFGCFPRAPRPAVQPGHHVSRCDGSMQVASTESDWGDGFANPRLR
jgi:hypothetical protein